MMNNKRAIYLLVVFGLLFLTLIGYITYLEIFYAEQFTESAYNPRNYELDRKVIRGSVYDKNGTLLAYSEKITEEKSEIIDGTEKKWTEEKIVRRYPFDNLYSHVVGYVSEDYSGRTLIENEYNSDLTESDILSKISSEMKYGEKKGKDVHLTIDHELQMAAYQAMGSYDGALVAMNPQTGEILAMVSKPDFNPNPGKFSLEDLEDTALFSRAIQMTYPPGSTYKIITAAAAIANGLEEETYDDTNGKFVIKSADGNEENDFSCQNVNRKAYGLTDLESAFKVSSNVYFCHLGVTLGTKELQAVAKSFLLGRDLTKEPGFDLSVAKSTFQTGSMTEAERAIASIGQGQTEMTPLHMALVASAIANNGVMPRAHLVSGVGADNKLTQTNAGVRIVESDIAQKIKDMMLSVVESGTGTAARINGIKVCGKTGTSENSLTAKGGKDSGKTHALFVGFAPYDDPQIAVSVVLEHAGFGGTYAAPIARNVMQKYLSSIGY